MDRRIGLREATPQITKSKIEEKERGRMVYYMRPLEKEERRLRCRFKAE
jgi:hypothetical protein